MTHAYAGVPLAILAGMGRSGTWAVREAIGMHPDLHSTGTENHIIHDLLGTAVLNCTQADRRVNMRMDQAAYDRLFHDLLLDLLWPRTRRPAPRRLFAFTPLTPDPAGRPGPMTALRADYLVRLFASIRIIHLVRNGVEVVSSRIRRDGFNHRPLESHCDAWAATVELARWGRDRDDFMQLRHEHLLDPETLKRTLDDVWAFLDIRSEPAAFEHLLTICRHPTGDRDAGRRPGEALQGRSERWRDWAPDQLRYFERTCGEAMEYYGYPMPWLDRVLTPRRVSAAAAASTCARGSAGTARR